MVAAELVAATHGLGFMIQSAAQFLVTDVVLGIPDLSPRSPSRFGLCHLERKLVPWAGRHEATSGRRELGRDRLGLLGTLVEPDAAEHHDHAEDLRCAERLTEH